MTWQPESGWPWLVGRWAVAAGAGVVLGGAVWFGESGSDRALALEPTTVREVVLDPQEHAELSSLVPDAGTPEDPTTDADEDARSRPDVADGSDDPSPDEGTVGRDDPDDGASGGGGTGGADSEAERESESADDDNTDREPADSDTSSDTDRDAENGSGEDEESD